MRIDPGPAGCRGRSKGPAAAEARLRGRRAHEVAKRNSTLPSGVTKDAGRRDRRRALARPEIDEAAGVLGVDAIGETPALRPRRPSSLSPSASTPSTSAPAAPSASISASATRRRRKTPPRRQPLDEKGGGAEDQRRFGRPRPTSPVSAETATNRIARTKAASGANERRSTRRRAPAGSPRAPRRFAPRRR